MFNLVFTLRLSLPYSRLGFLCRKTAILSFYFISNRIISPFFMQVLPSEFPLLDFYLNQSGGSICLRKTKSLFVHLEARFQSFLNIELCTSTREMIIDLYKTIFYGREDPLLFIPMNDLDLLLRTAALISIRQHFMKSFGVCVKTELPHKN